MAGRAVIALSFTEVGRRETAPPSTTVAGGERERGLWARAPPAPVHVQPHQTFPEHAAVGPPDNGARSLEGAAQVLPHGGTEGRLRDTLVGLEKVLPQRKTDGAPPRHAWGPEWGFPGAPATLLGAWRGPPRRSRKRGRRPRPSARAAVPRQSPPAEDAPDAPNPSATDPSARQRSPCLSPFSAAERPLRLLASSAPSPQRRLPASQTPRLRDTPFSTQFLRLTQNVCSAPDCVPPPLGQFLRAPPHS